MMNRILEKTTIGLAIAVITLLALINQINAQPRTKSSTKMERIELDDLVLSKPLNMIPRDVKGTDSQIWVFANQSIELTIERGHYASLPEIYKTKPDIKLEERVVSGRNSILISFREDDSKSIWPYVTAIYFSAPVTGAKKLSMYFRCRTREDRVTAIDILSSVRFKNK